MAKTKSWLSVDPTSHVSEGVHGDVKLCYRQHAFISNSRTVKFPLVHHFADHFLTVVQCRTESPNKPKLRISEAVYSPI